MIRPPSLSDLEIKALWGFFTLTTVIFIFTAAIMAFSAVITALFGTCPS